jgi:uncharacterized cupin superfamily protein
VVPEAPLTPTGHGLAPEGEGWFVVNAREAAWEHNEPGFGGSYTCFEGESRFPEIGINVSVLRPGEVSCMYHGEDAQEDFLVLSGECLLIVESQERPLHAWDFVHCPAWTEHVFVGAGEGPCVIVAVGGRHPGHDGSRSDPGVIYPRNETALRHGASVEETTPSATEAYARFSPAQPGRYREGDLP